MSLQSASTSVQDKDIKVDVYQTMGSRAPEFVDADMWNQLGGASERGAGGGDTRKAEGLHSDKSGVVVSLDSFARFVFDGPLGFNIIGRNGEVIAGEGYHGPIRAWEQVGACHHNLIRPTAQP